MSITLYRKYRPQNFTDVLGQAVVVRTLQNALTENQIGHAYLFTGPRGTGKTSLARIFATAINCQKRNKKESIACGKCSHCQAVKESQSLDIIEIDAASHTGVDNIRELRDTMGNTPLLGVYKIFIIDEVHMLSAGAFNALLKIMEEPPAHVVFLLATTALHKVPATITSRCQRFALQALTLAEIRAKLSLIAKAEKISLDPLAEELIAKAARGALRDAESLLTQIAALTKGKVTREAVEETLGATNQASLHALLQALFTGQVFLVLDLTQKLANEGKDSTLLTTNLLEILHDFLLYRSLGNFNTPELKNLTDDEQRIFEEYSKLVSLPALLQVLEHLDTALRQSKTGSYPFLSLEIALVKIACLFEEKTTPDIPPSDMPPSPIPPVSTHKKPLKKSQPLETLSEETLKSVSNETSLPEKILTNRISGTPGSTFTIETVEKEWHKITKAVHGLNASLSVALQNARPVALIEGCIHIAVKYRFHKERLEEPAHQLTLHQAFDTILGARFAFAIIENKVEKASTPKTHSPLITEALELLGGTVL